MTADQKSRTDKGDELHDDNSADIVSNGATEAAEAEAAELEITESSADGESVESDSEKPRRTGLATKIGAGVLAVLLIAATALTAWLYFFQYRLDQQTGPAAADVALTAAQEGTVAVLSYAPESFDKDLANAKSHLTGDFLKYYDNFTNEVVRPAVQQKAVKTEAKVVNAAISELQPDRAVALVFVNQTTLSKDREDPSLAASSVRVTMDKVDGKWLISAFDPV